MARALHPTLLMLSFSRSAFRHLRASLILSCGIALVSAVPAENVRVLHREGTLRGFLELSDAAGKRIATGDLFQATAGDRVTSRLVFNFNDGSIDDERTIFTQRGVFRLIRDHHIQKGPFFPHPSDVLIDMRSGQVTTRTEKDGKPSVQTGHMDLPPDLANGLPSLLVKNLTPGMPQTKVSFLASTPKPRLVHLAISSGEEKTFSVGRSRYKAIGYVIHIELGGVAGVIAPVIGKQPPDLRIWVSTGEAPAFIREEGQIYEDGPKCTIQLISPVWPGDPQASTRSPAR